MNAPSSWKKFCQVTKNGSKPDRFGFVAPIDSINRFAARFRVATSLKLVRFDKITSETSAGYTGLMKVALSYSTLEVYASLIESDKQKLRPRRVSIFERGRNDSIFRLARKLSTERGILKTILQETNPVIQQKLRGFDPDSIDSLYYLSEGIRHIFFHGLLTANSAGSKPKFVHDLGCALSTKILDGIDADFTLRVGT